MDGKQNLLMTVGSWHNALFIHKLTLQKVIWRNEYTVWCTDLKATVKHYSLATWATCSHLSTIPSTTGIPVLVRMVKVLLCTVALSGLNKLYHPAMRAMCVSAPSRQLSTCSGKKPSQRYHWQLASQTVKFILQYFWSVIVCKLYVTYRY